MALAFFPRWGWVLDVAGYSLNPGAFLGVAALGFVIVRMARDEAALKDKWVQAEKVRREEGLLHEEVKRKSEEITLSLERFKELESIGRSLGGVLNKDQLIQRVLESVLKIARCDIGYLALFDYNRNEFAYEIGMGMDATMLRRSRYPIEDAVIKKIVDRRELLTVPFSKQAEQVEFFSIKQERLDQFRAVVFVFAVPVLVENNILGIVTFYANESSAEFINANPTLFQVTVNQAAVALGSAIQCEYAVLDRLTLVYNHEYFQRRLMEELSRCRRYKLKMSLLMLDIDHFKRFNDTYGHQVGDQVLKTVSSVLKRNVRVIDLCARYGGEEFAIIFPETPLTGDASALSEADRMDPQKAGGAVMKADQLRRLIESQPFDVKGEKVVITVSVGVAGWQWPDDSDVEKETIIKRADDFLYQAKKAGRNRVVWTPVEITKS